MPADAALNVSGKCARSQLMSVRDCQAITKKAVIERLRQHTHRDIFRKTGAAYPIDVSLHADVARITLDTSGEALNRRGYRPGTARPRCANPGRRPGGAVPLAARHAPARPLLRHRHATHRGGLPSGARAPV